MDCLVAGGFNSGLKELVVEASRALARLDTERLEELALSCEALNREMKPRSNQDDVRLVRKAQEAQGEMAIFARVLEATRANLDVMNRLRELREGHYEYGEAAVKQRLCLAAEESHGDN